MKRLLAIIGSVYGKLGFQAKLWIVAVVLALASYEGFVRYERAIGKREVLLSQSEKNEKAAVASLVPLIRQNDSLVKAGKHSDSLLTAAHNKASVAVSHVKEKEKFFQDSSAKDSVSQEDLDEYMGFVDEALAAKDAEIAAANGVNANLLSRLVVKDSTISAHERIEASLRQQNNILKSQTTTSSSKVRSLVKLAEIGAAGYVGYRVGKH